MRFFSWLLGFGDFRLEIVGGLDFFFCLFLGGCGFLSFVL